MMEREEGRKKRKYKKILLTKIASIKHIQENGNKDEIQTHRHSRMCVIRQKKRKKESYDTPE